MTEGLAVEIGRKGKQSEAVAFLPQSFARKLDTPARAAAAEAAYIKAVLADKPLGYWPLNEPVGTTKFLDRSGNGFHGYAINRVAAGQPGPLPDNSHAVAFDGDGFINVGGRDEFALKNGFTVEAWVWIGDIRRQLYGRVISVDPGTPRDPSKRRLVPGDRPSRPARPKCAARNDYFLHLRGPELSFCRFQ